MFATVTNDKPKVRLIGRLIFGETNVFIEAKGRIFDLQWSNGFVQFSGVFNQLRSEFPKIISDHEIEIFVAVHSLHIVVFFDCFEESKGYGSDYFGMVKRLKCFGSVYGICSY
ncbi:MAG: hypothetical protein WCJ39_04715 [bacterium]